VSQMAMQRCFDFAKILKTSNKKGTFRFQIGWCLIGRKQCCCFVKLQLPVFLLFIAILRQTLHLDYTQYRINIKLFSLAVFLMGFIKMVDIKCNLY